MSDRPLVAVLDYGIGNLRSAEKSLERMGADAHLTADRELIADAAGVVLPGVGAFGRCMEELRASGLDEVAVEAIAEGRPFLAICIGMQLLYRASEESPDCPGLGVIDADVVRMSQDERLPQMQWNVLRGPRGTGSPTHEMFAGLDDPAWVYFVHSYAASWTEDVVATCEYGGSIAAAVARGGLWATQFHPEKSGENGLAMLGNFIRSLESS
jgi:glutamine amidotransferase